MYKYLLAIVVIVLVYIGSVYLFNYVNPWLGVVVGTVFSIYLVEAIYRKVKDLL